MDIIYNTLRDKGYRPTRTRTAISYAHMGLKVVVMYFETYYKVFEYTEPNDLHSIEFIDACDVLTYLTSEKPLKWA